MGKPHQVIYYRYNDEMQVMEKCEGEKKINGSILFFFLMAFVIIGLFCQFFLIPSFIDAQFFGVQLEESIGIAMWVCVGIGIVSALIYTSYVRSNNIKFRDWLGAKYNLESFEGVSRKEIAKVLGEAVRDDFKERYPGKEYDADTYLDQELKEWKIATKIAKAKERGEEYDPTEDYKEIKKDYVYDDLENTSDFETEEIKDGDPIKQFLESKKEKYIKK